MDVDSENDVFGNRLEFCFASHDVFARQQQLPNCTLFQLVLHVNVLNMVEMIFVENVYFSGLAFLQRDWKMHLQHVQMHEFGMFVLHLEFGI